MEPEGSLPHSPVSILSQLIPVLLGRTKVSVRVRGFVCEYSVTMIRFQGEELLAPRPNPKLEDHPFSAVRDCLFNIIVTIIHVEGRSSIRNLRTPLAMATGTHLSHDRGPTYHMTGDPPIT
jgi:hypothetical protein